MLQLKNNAFYSNTFLIFVARFFPTLANLIVIIYYSRFLTQTAYGNYSHFWIHLNIIYPIACFGIHLLMVTYSPAEIGKLIKNISRKQYIVYFLWVSLFAVIFAYIQNVNLGISFFVGFIYVLLFSYTVLFEAALIVYKKYTTLIFINVLYSTSFIFIHWFIVKDGFNLGHLFYYLLLILSIKFLLFLITIYRAFTEKISRTPNFETLSIKTVKSLWLHLGIYDISQNLFNWVDKFIVSLLLTASMSAIYYNGTLNIPFLPLLLSSAASSVLMQLAVSNKHEETKSIIRLLNQKGKILSCIVFPVFYFLLLYRYDIFVTVLSEKYREAVPVFTLMLFALPIRAYSFTTILQRFHKGLIINIGSLLDIIIACLLMYPLYKLLGLPGISLAFVLSSYFQAWFYLHHTSKLLEVKIWMLLPLSNWMLKLAAFGVLLFGIHQMGLLFFPKMINLGLGILSMTVVILISLWFELKKSVNSLKPV